MRGRTNTQNRLHVMEPSEKVAASESNVNRGKKGCEAEIIIYNLLFVLKRQKKKIKSSFVVLLLLF